MTTLKRIIAVVLAVMLIASIGVIGASAAGEKLTIDATGEDAKGFTFDIYRVATLNTTTGEYTPANNAVKAAVNAVNQPGADFLAALQAISDPGTLVKDDLKEAKYETETAGIYYAKVVGTPENPTLKKDVVIVWPEAASDGTYTMSNLTVDLSDKVSSSPVRVTKAFAVNDTTEGKSLGQVAGTNTVDFLLTATIAGSVEKRATDYYIWDMMSKGLTYDKSTVKVYKDDALTQDITNKFTISDGEGITEEGAYNGGTYFKITAKTATLNGNEFYGWGTIYVKYTATLNANAVVAPDYNPNKNGLHAVVDGQPIDKNGDERKVLTYNLKIKKVDGTNNAPLKDAEFDLNMNGTKIAHGKSDANGIVEFYATGETAPIKLAPTANGIAYTVVETKAVDGYAKNTDVIPVQVTTNSTVSAEPAFTVPNFPTKIPQTGGAGTLLFTIGGIALILAAGVMFIIIMKKRTSSK